MIVWECDRCGAQSTYKPAPADRYLDGFTVRLYGAWEDKTFPSHQAYPDLCESCLRAILETGAEGLPF